MIEVIVVGISNAPKQQEFGVITELVEVQGVVDVVVSDDIVSDGIVVVVVFVSDDTVSDGIDVVFVDDDYYFYYYHYYYY